MSAVHALSGESAVGRCSLREFPLTDGATRASFVLFFFWWGILPGCQLTSGAVSPSLFLRREEWGKEDGSKAVWQLPSPRHRGSGLIFSCFWNGKGESEALAHFVSLFYLFVKEPGCSLVGDFAAVVSTLTALTEGLGIVC